MKHDVALAANDLQLLKKAEWAAALLLTVIVLILLFVRATHAGALWRDECAVVQLSRTPDLAGVFQHSESFPFLFPMLIRAYTGLFGTSDSAFRIYGFVIGALLVGILWFNARLLGGRLPLLSLVLLGLNTAMLTWANTIRGYGLGCVLILFAYGLMAKAALQTTRLWLLTATLAALACVQFLFFNVVLLAAIGGAAIITLALRRNLKTALAMLGIALLATLSLQPNFSVLSASRQWNMLLKQPADLLEMWGQLNATLGAPLPILIWVWHLLLVAVMAGAVRRLWDLQQTKPSPEWDRLLFGVLTAIISLVGYYVFLNILSYPTRPWYFLALLSVLAATIGLLSDDLVQETRLRVARLCFVIAAMIILPFATWPQLHVRHTNMDSVAQMLQQQSKPTDLIVLNPWYYGIAFDWHYHGSTTWVTVPRLTDHRLHRYDLLKWKMLSPNPLDDVIARLAQTLRDGGRIWLVGKIVSANPGEAPVALSPAPDPQYGWDSRYYAGSWSQQIVFFLEQHASQMERVDVPTTGPVGNLENASVVLLQGWREKPEP
ncbi:MAG: glycosyltransferase family 39 protein [Verrucomicrobia bacterium]|jgi:hypothetical protein|nr:glycosyltransferase family 39 protein [Verrucomicrobiota bacterium]